MEFPTFVVHTWYSSDFTDHLLFILNNYVWYQFRTCVVWQVSFLPDKDLLNKF